MKKCTSFLILSFAVLVLLVSLHSCKLQSIDPEDIDLGYDYFPLEVGRYVIYDEHDIIYDPTKTIDTSYHVKEVIHDSYLEGKEEKFIVYRFAKKTDATTWPIQPDSVWTIVRTANQLLRTESNFQYIKLVFPVKEGKTWNGNAKNISGKITSSDKFYKMTDLNKPYIGIDSVYPYTLKMTIANQSDPIVSMDIRYEIYARGLGLIKKDYTVYYYKQDPSLPAKTIDYGSRKIMEITGHGKD